MSAASSGIKDETENPLARTHADALEAEANERSRIRADFIQRIFAVVVSVGFATQLIHQMDWVNEKRSPSDLEFQHIIYLIIGLVLTIQSWEHYFTKIERRPLKRESRFYLDIIIVFSYLILMTFSAFVRPFLLTVCWIFFLYTIWDFLSFRDYPDQLKSKDTRLRNYLKLLISSTRNKRAPAKKKLSTIIALLWFAEIYVATDDSTGLSPYWAAATVLGGLIVYRADQNHQYNSLVMILPVLAGAILLVITHIFPL